MFKGFKEDKKAKRACLNSRDTITGTDGNDTYIARGNSSLNNADIIDGGKGIDTLEVMLDNDETAESPLLTSIEVLKVQAQSRTEKSGDNQVDGSTEFTDLESNIDAGDMKDTVEYWSEDSRANLVIEGIEQASIETTIGMRDTDASVDYAAFFYDITNNGSVEDGATLTLDLVNVQALTDGNDALTDNQYKGFKFTLDGVEYTVESEAFAAATTYEALKTAINAQFLELGLSTLSATLGGATTVYNSDTGANVGSKTAIVITNSADGVLDYNNTDAWITDPNAPATDNVAAKMTNEAPSVSSSLTQTDIILDDAGHGSKGGSLLAGNMSDGTTHDGSNGIQQFNVEVDRDSWIEGLYTTANDLEKIVLENISTNNTDGNGSVVIEDIQDVQTLDATAMKGSVNVTANLSSEVAAKYMNLTDTGSNPASDNIGFNYSLGTVDDTLNLTISNANLAAAGSTTREDFELEINGNGGNDTITTIIGDGTVGTTNWYVNSTINANLEVNGGAGEDTITTLGAGNFTIDAGTGADTVYTDNSAKEATVTGTETTAYGVAYNAVYNATTGLQADLSSKEDTYNGSLTNADLAALNTAKADLEAGEALLDSLNDGKAVFVFNTADQTNASNETDITDLVSNAATATPAVNLGLTVTFKGVTTDISEVANSFGATSNVNVTNLQINQAIKDAINNDDALSKFLVAKDGPANTLVVESLIDGSFTLATDLTINFGQLTENTYTAGQVADAWDITNNGVSSAVFAKQGTDGLTTTGVKTTLDTAGDYTTAFATVGTDDVNGIASAALSANTVNLGAGNSDDVLVLGTLAAGDDTSKDTVIYEDANFGHDTILNFETSNDKLDFSAFVTVVGTGTSIVEAGNATAAGTFNTLYAANSTTNTDLAIADYITNGTQASATGSSTSVVFLTDGSDDTLAYAYQITDAVGANTANATVSATLLGSIELGDVDFAIGDVIA